MSRCISKAGRSKLDRLASGAFVAIRSIASLSLTFGLVSIPVKVYLATESSAAIKFKLMAASGARLRQQYVEDAAPLEVGSHAEAEQEEPSEFEEAAARGNTVSQFPRFGLERFQLQRRGDPSDPGPGTASHCAGSCPGRGPHATTRAAAAAGSAAAWRSGPCGLMCSPVLCCGSCGSRRKQGECRR